MGKSDIIDEKGHFRELTWNCIWEKENNKFNAQIQYYIDPNVQDNEESMCVEYKYTIVNPVNTQ